MKWFPALLAAALMFCAAPARAEDSNSQVEVPGGALQAQAVGAAQNDWQMRHDQRKEAWEQKRELKRAQWEAKKVRRRQEFDQRAAEHDAAMEAKQEERDNGWFDWLRRKKTRPDLGSE